MFLNGMIFECVQIYEKVLVSVTTKNTSFHFRSVTDLARLSLDKPVYVSVHENSTNSTPDNLTQSYVVTDLQNKVVIICLRVCFFVLRISYIQKGMVQCHKDVYKDSKDLG